MAAAASAAVREPLNLSGAMRIRMAPYCQPGCSASVLLLFCFCSAGAGAATTTGGGPRQCQAAVVTWQPQSFEPMERAEGARRGMDRRTGGCGEGRQTGRKPAGPDGID